VPEPWPWVGDGAPLRDERRSAPVVERDLIHRGMVWDIVADTFDLGDAGRLTREYVAHPGAVAVLALDDHDHAVVIRQYRHPVGAFEWELPAGLLDVDGEEPHRTAARELSEEADLIATRWDLLVDHHGTPGGSSESIRIYLARGLAPVPAPERHQRTGEELGMPVRRVPLDVLADAVLAGDLLNPSLAVGVLAAVRLRDRGWAGLRAVDVPWPARSPVRASIRDGSLRRTDGGG
jgi:8-oxo-dGDP phosphatase